MVSLVKVKREGWGCSSIVERLPSMCDVMNSIPSISKKEKLKREPLLYPSLVLHCLACDNQENLELMFENSSIVVGRELNQSSRNLRAYSLVLSA